MTTLPFVKRWSVHLVRQRSFVGCVTRPAYSLLEVVIALALLMALLAMGWSMMGTYATAELRGWKLANRLQAIRTARRWMQTDLRQIASQADVANGIGQSNQRVFWGTADRFQCKIIPSVEPVAMLHSALNSGIDDLDNDEVKNPFESLDASRFQIVTPSSPWPADEVDVEYRLEVIPTASADQLNRSSMDSLTDQPWYRLIRRELADQQTVATNRSENLNAASLYDSRNPLADRVLTGRDLYRQESNEVEENPYTHRIASIEAIVAANFTYYDGSTWSSQWDSLQRGGLPAAVALSFDLPTASEQRKVRELAREGQSAEEYESFVTAADTILATEPAAEETTTGQTQLKSLTETRQYHIVVAVTCLKNARQQTPTGSDPNERSPNLAEGAMR